jgi:hypothetical protein
MDDWDPEKVDDIREDGNTFDDYVRAFYRGETDDERVENVEFLENHVRATQGSLGRMPPTVLREVRLEEECYGIESASFSSLLSSDAVCELPSFWKSKGQGLSKDMFSGKPLTDFFQGMVGCNLVAGVDAHGEEENGLVKIRNDNIASEEDLFNPSIPRSLVRNIIDSVEFQSTFCELSILKNKRKSYSIVPGDLAAELYTKGFYFVGIVSNPKFVVARFCIDSSFVSKVKEKRERTDELLEPWC